MVSKNMLASAKKNPACSYVFIFSQGSIATMGVGECCGSNQNASSSGRDLALLIEELRFPRLKTIIEIDGP